MKKNVLYGQYVMKFLNQMSRELKYLVYLIDSIYLVLVSY